MQRIAAAVIVGAVSAALLVVLAPLESVPVRLESRSAVRGHVGVKPLAASASEAVSAATVLAAGAGADIVGPDRRPDAQPTDSSDADALPDLGKAPELRGIDAWINSRPLTLASLQGKVVVLEFWTLSCVNCLDAVPHVSAWQHRYRDRGLVVIGVHSPELPVEHDPARVEAAVNRYRIEYPVAIDNRLQTWNAYHNRYWPAFYFIDARGHVRYAHFGSGNYAANEAVIRRLLAERRPAARQAPPAGNSARASGHIIRTATLERHE